MKKLLFRIFVLVLFFCSFSLHATIITSTATGGDWATNSTWLGNVAPIATDTVIIATTGAGAVTSSIGTITCAGLTINSGSILTMYRPFIVNGTTSISGTINFGSTDATPRLMTFNGSVTLNTGAVWNETSVGAIPTFSLSDSFTNNAGTFTALSGLHTFTGSSMTFSGTTVTSIPSLTVTGTYTNNSTLTVPTALAGAGGLTNGTTGILNLNGTSAITTLTATAAGNTINYTGAAQTAKVTTYYNLTLSGSGIKTFATTPTVNNILSMEGTATVTVTVGVVTYGANATLQYNTATSRTATTEEWRTPFAATGGIIISNTGVITTGGAKVLNASIPLTINSGATLSTGATNTWTLNISGVTTISGTLTLANTGTKTFTGNVIINSGGVWNETGISAIVFGGNLQNDGATFNALTGNHTFSGSAKTVSGTSVISIPTAIFTGTYSNSGTLIITTLLRVTTVTFTNNNTVTATTALSGTGGFTQGTTAILNLGGTSAITTLSAKSVGNTVNYTGVTQTIKATDYSYLKLSGNGEKTFGANTNIAGNLDIESPDTVNLGTFACTANTLSFGGVDQIQGSWGGTGSAATNINTEFFAAATGILTVNPSFNSWTGSASTDWNVAGNWSAGAVPTSSHSVIVNSGGNQPFIGATAVCNDMLIYAGATLTISGTNTFTVSGNWTNNGTFTANASTVVFNGITKTIGKGPFYNLVLSGTSTVTTNFAVIIGGDLTIPAGTTFATGATNTWTLTVTGTSSVSGTISLANTGTKTFTGNVIINSGGVWLETAAAAFGFAGSLQNNGASFTASTGTHTFSGTGKTISGTSLISIPRLTFTGTCANYSTLTIGTALAGAGSFTNDTSGILNLGGTSSVTTFVATAAGNTVKYTGGSQTARVITYFNLTIAGSGTKTFATTPTVNNILSMEGTAIVTVTTGVVTYGSSATLQYNTATSRTASSEEWITPFGATGGVIIANTGVITTGAARVLDVNIPLTVNSGASLTTGANNTWTLTVGGETFVSGTLILANTGAKTFTGNVSVNSGGVWNETGIASIGFAGDLVNNGITFTASTGTHTFSGIAKIISGTSSISIPNVSITGSYTNNQTLSIGTSLSGAGGLINGGSGMLNLGGTSTITTLTATSVDNTVNYSGAAQAVKATTYYNLLLSGTGTKTLPGSALSLLGNLVISGTALVNLSNTLSVTGNVNIQTGSTLSVGTLADLDIGGDITIDTGGTLTVN